MNISPHTQIKEISKHLKNAQFFYRCKQLGISQPVPEHRFHPERKWRFDYAWPDKMLALEIDGGLFVNGGHSRGAAREGDYEKDANALMLGWRVMRVSTGQVKSGAVFTWLKAVLNTAVAKGSTF